jgi:hypothetical protein
MGEGMPGYLTGSNEQNRFAFTGLEVKRLSDPVIVEVLAMLEPEPRMIDIQFIMQREDSNEP